MWSRTRGLLLAAAILAVTGVIIAALRSGGGYGVLDPRSTDPLGSRAVAELLGERGVDTRVVTTAAEAENAAGPGTTLLVSDPDALSRHQRDALRKALKRGGRTVLIAPGPASTAALTPGVRAAAPAPMEPTPPDCDYPVAERAGDAELGGIRYSMTADHADACYLHQGLPSLLRFPADPGDRSGRTEAGRDTVLLGAPDPLFNDRLDEHGNASLMLQLLGSRPHLVWYLPSAVDSAAGGDERGFFDLLPDGWSWATLQLAIAAVFAALWRVRRLGPLVPERLPVSVRASETTEGRARLYRRANARDRAAESLRSAARSRLAPLAGVSAAQAHSPEILCPAVAAHALPRDEPPTAPRMADVTGQPYSDGAPIRSLLFGDAPANDADLIKLADDLDHLERRFSDAAPVSRRPTAKDRTS
ncbi:MAG: DUF4350 domain-containing protein [Streptomyces sp.]|uniref:DUF4350 domain-containing protein n=1 Tax=Streptomyces sp. TaxID=1931 RepID=UPI003D6B3F91